MTTTGLLRTGLAVVWVAMVSASAAAPLLADDWPQFLGPNRDATSAEKGLLRAWPEGGPKMLWRVDVGPGYGGAAVRDGKVYLLDRVDNQKEILRCLDLETGTEEWTVGYDAPGKVDHNGSRSTPAVGAKTIVTVGVYGHVVGVDRATHKPIWAKNLLQEYGGKLPNWAVAQSPLLYKDLVILAPQSRTVGMVALDPETGQERWRSGPIGGMAYASPAPATVDGVEQIVLVTTGGAAGVAADDGRVLWTYPYKCGIPVPGPMAVGDGRFFLTGGYNADSEIIRVRRTGSDFAAEGIHRFDGIGSHIHQPILVGQCAYALCNTNDKADGLVCFGLDGAIKWQTRRDPNLDKGGFVLTGDGLFYSMDGATGDLRILSPSPDGYKELAVAPGVLGGKEIWGPMALSNGRLVVRDQRQMKCLDVKGP